MTAATGSGFGGKPRPVVVIQSEAVQSETVICLMLTTELAAGGSIRVPILPDDGNGLLEQSEIMIDIPVTVRRDKIGGTIGMLNDADLVRLDRALALVLGLSR